MHDYKTYTFINLNLKNAHSHSQKNNVLYKFIMLIENKQ